MKPIYICIDLKSFYASVECKERNLDPLTTNLVVADEERSDKTICLAVSPSLKALGISGRPRLFEVKQKVKMINNQRLYHSSCGLHESSTNEIELRNNPMLKLDYIIAKPRMAYYIEYSAKIYQIYLRFVASEDIHVYSIDEVFIDATSYLRHYQYNPEIMAAKMIQAVLEETGITATAGIGTNLYLAKVAMDIVAKHKEANQYGVRMAYLDELSYRKLLWNHRPLSDFWRVGRGYVKRLEEVGLYTMGDIARCSIGKNEDLLYDLFGINAELLIDHAWGYEPCTMKDIKSYQPQSHNIGSSQVLHEPYTFNQGKIIVKEMLDTLVLDMIERCVVCDKISLTIGYDTINLDNKYKRKHYDGEIVIDGYGRRIPKHAHGVVSLPKKCASFKMMLPLVIKLYERICDHDMFIRRVSINAINIQSEDYANKQISFEQIDLFNGYDEATCKKEDESIQKEKQVAKTLLKIKAKYGKNAVLKAMDLEEGATSKDRNEQIGGHKA